MRVAVLGTGIMGAPMARRLRAAGHEVTVWNRSPERAAPLAAAGIAVAEDAAAAVDGVEVAVTMLADAAAVHAVLVGGGVLDALPDGAVLAQMSTIGLAGTEDVAHACETRGVALVDAPVLGTKGPAEQGALVVLASGAAADVERCAPVFAAVGARTVEAGEAGGGTRLKLVLNHWLLGLVTALADTVRLAEAIGVDPRAFLATIDGGPLGVPYAALKGEAMVERAFPPSFPLALAEKDAGLVLDAAARHDLALALMPVVRERLAAAVAAGRGGEDLAAVVLAGGALSAGGRRA